MTRAITERQRDVLCVIESSLRERGYPPTYREIMSVLGVTGTNGINDHLCALERKGYIARRDTARPRGITLLVHADGRPAGEPQAALDRLISVCARHGYSAANGDIAQWLEQRLSGDRT